MKKNLLLALVVLALVAMFVTMAVATNPVKTMTLTGNYFTSDTLNLKFRVSGFTIRDSLPAGITVNHKSMPLKCKYDGAYQVKCTVKDMRRYTFSPATVWVKGFVWYIHIPRE